MTLGGMLATPVPVSVTSAPPAGAGCVSTTVPIAEFPPTTGFGLNVRVEGTGGSAAHTTGLPPPPHTCGAVQTPQATHPQPSGIALQVAAWAAHDVVAEHGPHTLATPPPPQL